MISRPGDKQTYIYCDERTHTSIGIFIDFHQSVS